MLLQNQPTKIAYSYSNILKLHTTGLRFFTVYGMGKTDMSLFKFVKNGLLNKNEIFNYGKHLRDFTYVDDIVFYIDKIIKLKTNTKKYTARCLQYWWR